jgi:hypothetical protein
MTLGGGRVGGVNLDIESGPWTQVAYVFTNEKTTSPGDTSRIVS